MSTGNWLYLLMAIGMFGVLSAVLAYQSWQQSLRGPDVVPVSDPEQQADAHHQVAA
jgi:hypothetical protein